jgi:hypothetical protein
VKDPSVEARIGRVNGGQRTRSTLGWPTSTHRPTAVPDDVTFSGQDISGSSDEEGKIVTNRLFQRHNREEFIRNRPKLTPTDFFWESFV